MSTHKGMIRIKLQPAPYKNTLERSSNCGVRLFINVHELKEFIVCTGEKGWSLGSFQCRVTVLNVCRVRVVMCTCMYKSMIPHRVSIVSGCIAGLNPSVLRVIVDCDVLVEEGESSVYHSINIV